VIRDVGEDARKNRIYIPMEDLQRFEVPASDILLGRESAAFRALMGFEAQRARTYYDKAMAALPPEDRRAQRSGLIMSAIYRSLLEEIERDEFRVLSQKTALTPLRKLYIAWRTWLAG
jgi:phytoene synthase